MANFLSNLKDSIFGNARKNKDIERANNILNQYKQFNFVDRVLNREKYPFIDYGDGNYATHKMAWGEGNGKYYVYPTIVYNKNKNALTELEPKMAAQYARTSGEFIPFDTPEEAEWFSKNYKSVWR